MKYLILKINMESQINNMKTGFTFSSVLNYLKAFNKHFYLKLRSQKDKIQPTKKNKSQDFSIINEPEMKWDIYGNLSDECK